MNPKVLLFVMAVASAAIASEPSDGIYSVADVNADTGTTVIRSDNGDPIKLQRLLTSGFGTPSIVSMGNHNERFRLTLKSAGPFRKDTTSIHQAVHIDGVCVLGTGQEVDDQQRSTFVGDFASLENAKKLARALSIAPQLRRHPGHKLVVKWKPSRKFFKPSQPIDLTLTVENVGDVPVYFIAGGSQRGPRDNQFAFIAHRESGFGKVIPDTGDPETFGGIGSLITLAPGELFTKSVDVSKWFQFTAPEMYWLTCVYQIEMSNDDRDSVIWDEFLTGQCDIQIQE